ncbi:MFS transporter [Bacillus marinisedimentorum]|uniref:MFS transporter n=1 Tax=Bacillus marinisedimentorum TaxID=1821260 RepID=UPI0007DE82E6|nr:MFS transporter [Bacillus marinisedimentorum]
MRNVHRGWIVLLFIVLSVLACLGFGRFALGAIIPFMKDGLGLSYRETGLVASSVFLGYLISVTTVGYFVLRYKAKDVILFSLLLTIAGMLINANAAGFWSAYLGCLITGIGSGGTYIPALGLLGQWFAKEKKGMAMGTAMAGAGMGIAFSGLAVPYLMSLIGASGWRTSWYILAAAVGLIAVLDAFFLKNSPSEFGLRPIGEKEPPKAQTKKVPYHGAGSAKDHVYRNRLVWLTGFIYLSWGFSYIVFSTFLVDYLMEGRGFSKELAGTSFAAAGLFSIVSGFIWGSLSDRIGRMFTLGIVYGIQGVMLLALTLFSSPSVLFAVIVIYSITLWGVPSIMNASVGDYVSALYVPVAMGFITLFFSIGQFVSPVAIGFLIDYTGGYLEALLLSTAVCLAGGIGAFVLHHKNKSSNSTANSAAHAGN